MSDKHTITPMKEKRWRYHDADCNIVARKLERFCSGDLQIISHYLHANDEPTIAGLAKYAERCWGKLDNICEGRQ